MRTLAMTEKFLTSIWLTVIARASLLIAPFVFSFITWFTYQIYTNIQESLEIQQKQILEIKEELQDHQFRLDSGKSSLNDLQVAAEKQFAKLDERLEGIANKIAGMNDSVVRVQTIIETRLPMKEGNLKWLPQ